MRLQDSGRRRVSGCLCAVAFLVVLFLAACTDEDAASPSAASSSAPATPSTSATDDTEDINGDEATCLGPQRRAINRSRTWLAVDEVSRSVTGTSPDASRIMRRDSERVTELLQQACGQVPDPARAYVRVVRTQAAAPMGDTELDRMLEAWLRWGTAVGHAEDAQDTIEDVRACRGYEKDITVTHRVWWAWTDTGKRWWIDLTFDNRTGRLATGSTGGQTQVTGARPAGGFPPLTTWGGSGADQLFLRPGVSQVQPFGPVGVHTTSDGTFEVRDIWVALGTTARSSPVCELPVPADR